MPEAGKKWQTKLSVKLSKEWLNTSGFGRQERGPILNGMGICRS